MARFAGRFVVLLAVCFGVLALPPVRRAVVTPWNAGLAGATAAIAATVGLPARAVATSVVGPGFALEIVDACNGLDAAGAFAAALLATSGPLAGRLRWLAGGGVVLAALNLVRLVTLFAVGLAAPPWLPAAHYVGGQAFLLFATVALFAAALARTGGLVAGEHTTPAATARSAAIPRPEGA